eukprot:Protomagalhaensia_wolfi_Nauph_80__5808@NODE_724_length_2067_cov_141_518245_g540_i0_p2_GENE_NODE_724_length_2067_cov_141_518245_g540_i0NODE_724_length_2067_cov_141_518245_g540_i0_p2_ORF_typecomplete_len255_score69_55EF1_GNE/PF00736_19/6_7e03EF1_GNE/PF00736_19/9_2e03EF1_GNE/PF00736_19/6_4e16Ribosomal_60s/PF00428_19/0_013Ribosomal_60s/PF00428_19/1_9e03Ribosomal_60s/PF00428_19/1_8e04SMODS/PF18144_1/0_065SMODS/PF18144_1/5_1e03DUF2204/PF09970_9/0_064_NODE_724_length_2067_cov_141_518245_g540_i060824
MVSMRCSETDPESRGLMNEEDPCVAGPSSVSLCISTFVKDRHLHLLTKGIKKLGLKLISLSLIMASLDLEVPARLYALAKGAAAPAAAPAAEEAKKAEDDIDLFGEEEDTEAQADLQAALAAKQEAVKEEKKKKVVIAKSSVTLNAMPYDSEVDITGIYETKIKTIEIDGLVWGVPFSVINGPFGLRGLQFGCAIEDDKVKTDDIEEAVETIGLSPEDKEKYIAMRRDGSLDDYEEEWEGKLVGTVKVVSFQKI